MLFLQVRWTIKFESYYVCILFVRLYILSFVSFCLFLLIKDMDALKYIDVASNLIRFIENGTFAHTPNLRTVHLEYNILTDTSAITAPQLSSVFLEGNVHLHRGISKVSKHTHVFSLVVYALSAHVYAHFP